MTTSTALTVKQKYVSVKEMLQANVGAVGAALPKGIDPNRMMQTALIACMRNPALLDADRNSMLSALREAATLGLEVDGVQGHGYLVPFYDKKSNSTKVQFMPGYKGLIELARRSGQVVSIDARVVYEGDLFEYQYGLDPFVRHAPGEVRDPKKLKAAYAVCKMKDGGVQFEVMLKVDVEAIQRRSRAGNSGPWVSDTAEMWKKTALRRLCKMLPMSAEDARVVTKAELADAGIAPVQDFDPVTGEVPMPEDPSVSALDAAAARAPVEAHAEVVP